MTRPEPRDSAAKRRDAKIIAALADWFDRHARPLPWRETDPLTGRRDPYTSLVSEFMLQQTQVSRVLLKFGPFLARFPTVESLANAPEDNVLAEWSGLGYYRRAKNLHAAAKMIAGQFAGRVPGTVKELRTLPGVGRYTAGSIVSIAMGIPAPIVDGNVLRVLMRLDAHGGAQTDAATQTWAWARAGSLAAAAKKRVASFNEGLMELGALVCTPASPRCEACPLSAWCQAKSQDRQNKIPPPKTAKAGQRLLHAAILMRDAHGRLLIEQRPGLGLWAGLWQAPTIEAEWKDRAEIGRWMAGAAARGLLGGTPAKLTVFDRVLSHRRVRFEVWTVPTITDGVGKRRLTSAAIGPDVTAPAERHWRQPKEIESLGLSVPQRRILLEFGSQHAAPSTRRERAARNPRPGPSAD